MEVKMRKSNKLKGIILSMVMFLIAILAFSAVFVQRAGADDQQAQNVSLMVKLVDGLATDEQAAIIASNGGVETSSIPPLRLHIVEIPASELSDVFSNYQSDPRVQSVEVNNKRKAEKNGIEGKPKDRYYLDQWALPKIGWDAVFGAVVPIGVSTVAVLDTGVDVSHPDLIGSLVSGTSIIDVTDGLIDPNGHGTWLG